MAGPTRSSTNWSTATTHVDYSSSSTPSFIPEVWAGKLVENFYPATVFGDIANTDYEGLIRGMGDNVIIRTTPTITIGDYEVGQQLTYGQPTSDQVELAIDKAKFFTFQVNSVDKMQSDLALMDVWSKEAGESMKVAIDTDILGAIYADAATANAGQTAGAISGDVDLGAAHTDGSKAVQLTKSTVIDYILDHNLVLDEQNAPQDGRWMILPAWACQKIKSSELHDASVSGDGTSMLRNGRIGIIDRTTIYSSNNVASATETAVKVFHVMAGHKKATTFAAQMTEMETLPNPNDFGQLVRGLNVYGYQVVDETLLTHGVVKK